jgi:hypothetical protein
VFRIPPPPRSVRQPCVSFVNHPLPTEWAKPIINTPSACSNPCHFPIMLPLITSFNQGLYYLTAPQICVLVRRLLPLPILQSCKTRCTAAASPNNTTGHIPTSHAATQCTCTWTHPRLPELEWTFCMSITEHDGQIN